MINQRFVFIYHFCCDNKRNSEASCFQVFFFLCYLFLFFESSLNLLFSLISPAHSRPLSLRPGPPRQLSLCAPAVPLLWPEFVLLCFRMATIEAAPTSIHPSSRFLFSLASSLTGSFSSPYSDPKNNRRGLAFVSGAGVLDGWKGIQAMDAHRSGREFIQAWIPHL